MRHVILVITVHFAVVIWICVETHCHWPTGYWRFSWIVWALSWLLRTGVFPFVVTYLLAEKLDIPGFDETLETTTFFRYCRASFTALVFMILLARGQLTGLWWTVPIFSATAITITIIYMFRD